MKARSFGAFLLSSALAIAAGYWSGVMGNSVATGAEGEGVNALLKDWQYPGAKLLEGFSTHTGRGVKQPRVETEQAHLVTDDPIAKVVSHIEEKIGVNPGAKGIINLTEAHEKIFSIQDDTNNRTLRTWIFNSHETIGGNDVSTNLVINVDNGKTHIAILRMRQVPPTP